jgi:hypothetical protein
MRTKPMRRRRFITLLGGAVAAWPFVTRAERGGRVKRIGVLSGLSATDPDAVSDKEAFEKSLQN